MTAIAPASARLIVPSAEFIAAYIEAQQASGAALSTMPRILHHYIATANAQKSAYQQLWMVAGSSVVGRVSLRPQIGTAPDELTGHIAYEVFPAFRRRGFGHRALALGMDELRKQGVGDLLLLCEEDNLASVKIIEAAGGRLEKTVPHRDFPHRLIRRYWVRETADKRASAARF